ncbi:hypothetical protein ACE6H2_006741 [Prunus campanulata]
MLGADPLSRAAAIDEDLHAYPELKKNINIDDLPEVVLVEILCRLPRKKYAFRCKCVSKRWSAIISDPLFIHHFLRLQSDDKHTPIIRTMINYNVDLLKLPKFTDPVMERSLESLNSFLHTVSSKLTDLVIERQLKLEKRLFFIPNVYKDLKPGVVGTYDDLVLCCAAKHYQRDYYICNPYTQQWVALPPSPQCLKRVVAVGFICDHKKKATQQLNNTAAEYIYRHRVVSIPEFSHCQAYTFKYYVEIFSSGTREWRASYISFPKKLAFHGVNPSIGFAHKGMLFWVGRDKGRAFLIGFDPFDSTRRKMMEQLIENVSLNLTSRQLKA